MTSPNFPANYPNRLHERKTIEVAKGNVIKIHFTDFDLERPDQVDYVDILDGDGSFLGRKERRAGQARCTQATLFPYDGGVLREKTRFGPVSGVPGPKRVLANG